MRIRAYQDQDLPKMIAIWNEVVEEGIAFPQEECLNLKSGRDFFAAQSHRVIVLHNTAATMAMFHDKLGKDHAMRIAAEANLDNRISGLQVHLPIGEAACVAARGRKKPERSTQHTDLVKRSKAR